MYLLAILLPPVAVLIKKGPIAALFNCVLCIFLWVPAIVHALLVVSSSQADARSKKLEDVMKEAAILNVQTMKAGQSIAKTVDVMDQIERLAKLKVAGHLTQEEFDFKKQQLLN